jgi:hypothetical protein
MLDMLAGWQWWLCWLELQDSYSGSAGWMVKIPILAAWLWCLCWLAVYAG